MAKFGIALRSGRRGRRFKSCHLDLNKQKEKRYPRRYLFLFKKTFLISLRGSVHRKRVSESFFLIPALNYNLFHIILFNPLRFWWTVPLFLAYSPIGYLYYGYPILLFPLDRTFLSAIFLYLHLCKFIAFYYLVLHII